MDRSFANVVAGLPVAHVRGRFQRHTSPQYRTLSGSRGGGRWGPPGAYPVIYLGRPTDSVIGEAYRHLVDPVEGLRGEHVGPRVLLTCDVAVSNVLDLRSPESLAQVGLSEAHLLGYDYGACQRVGAAAHQLGLAGVLAPAATRIGETLALFERNLEQNEIPVLTSQEVWAQLPPDPRPTSDVPMDEFLMRRVPRRKAADRSEAEPD